MIHHTYDRVHYYSEAYLYTNVNDFNKSKFFKYKNCHLCFIIEIVSVLLDFTPINKLIKLVF